MEKLIWTERPPSLDMRTPGLCTISFVPDRPRTTDSIEFGCDLSLYAIDIRVSPANPMPYILDGRRGVPEIVGVTRRAAVGHGSTKGYSGKFQ